MTLTELVTAWTRRKQFEAQLMAKEMAQVMAGMMGMRNEGAPPFFREMPPELWMAEAGLRWQ